jgi:predicted RNA-binding Zn ribbon-like protein
LSFVNTRTGGNEAGIDRILDADSLDRRRRARGLPAISGSAAGMIGALRQAAREIFAAVERRESAPESSVALVNAAADEPVRPVLETGLTRRWEPFGEGTAIAAIARDVIELVVSPDGLRIRTCAAPDCDRMFLQDHGRRIWCSPQCGGRVRARRHQTAHSTRMSQPTAADTLP